MQGGGSIFLAGQGGTGKTHVTSQQAQLLSGYRIYAVAKIHVATAGLDIVGDSVTQCTLAAFQRRYVALG